MPKVYRDKTCSSLFSRKPIPSSLEWAIDSYLDSIFEEILSPANLNDTVLTSQTKTVLLDTLKVQVQHQYTVIVKQVLNGQHPADEDQADIVYNLALDELETLIDTYDYQGRVSSKHRPDEDIVHRFLVSASQHAAYSSDITQEDDDMTFAFEHAKL